MPDNLKESLEAIFNAIPKDGTNIKDEEDDNGYGFGEKDATVSFDELASEVSEKVEKAPTVKRLREPSAETAETPVQAPVAAPAAVPAAPPAQQTPDEIEELLTQTMASAPTHIRDPQGIIDMPDEVKEVPIPAPSHQGDELIVDKKVEAPVVVVEQNTNHETIVKTGMRDEHKDDRVEALVPEATAEVVEKPAPAVTKKKTSKAVKSETETVDKSDIEVAPKSSDDGIVWADDAVIRKPFTDEDGWSLYSDKRNADIQEFYATKRRMLPLMLVGGKLPFRKLTEEVSSCHCNANCDFNPVSLYEKMVEIQGFKDRVREIQGEVNDQYFLWKRFVEVMRAQAATIEDVKVALKEAAAMKHTLDLDMYWAQLEGLQDTCVKVMRTLDSAQETCSRGVTISLPDRQIERYQSNRDFSESKSTTSNTSQQNTWSSSPPPAPKPQQSESYDSLHDKPTHPVAPARAPASKAPSKKASSGEGPPGLSWL